jgi:hypothetical protein
MKTRLQITIIALLLCGITAGIVFWNRPSERVRREVDYWFHGYSWWNKNLSPDENNEAYRKAVAQLSPEVVAVLAEDMKRPDTAIKAFNDAMRSILWRRGYAMHQNFRARAAYGLAAIGPGARSAVPQLIDAAKSGDGELEMAAAYALGVIALPETNVIAALSQMTNGVNSTRSFVAEIALWRLRPENEDIVGMIQSRIASPAFLPGGDWHNVNSLSALGTNARVFVPALRTALTNKAPFGTEMAARTFIAQALWKIDGSSDAALFALATLTNAIASTVPQSDAPGNLLWMSSSLKEVPEFCAAARPLIQPLNFTTNAQLTALKSNLLKDMEKTLRSNSINVAHSSTNRFP